MAKPGVDVRLRGLEKQIAEIETFRGEAKQNLERAVTLTTGAVWRKARRNMRGPKTGRTYRIGGRTHQASAPREGPAIFSRGLFRSIFKRVMGLGGQVGSDEEKAGWLEFGVLRAGGNRMERRPWLRPAVRDERKSWFRRLRRALSKAGRTARAQGMAQSGARSGARRGR